MRRRSLSRKRHLSAALLAAALIALIIPDAARAVLNVHPAPYAPPGGPVGTWSEITPSRGGPVARSQASCPAGPSNSDLWDIQNGTNVVSSTGFLSGNDAEGTNIFGGSFSTNEPETAFFRDDQADGFIHTVEWETLTDVTVTSFYLRAAHDQGIIRRAFRTFRLFAFNASQGQFELLYSLNTPLPYGDGPEGNVLVFCADVPLRTTNLFKAEFVQEGSGTFFGPRVIELDGLTASVGGAMLDRQALIELYNSTNGANWFNNTNWGSAEPISEWYGVTESVSPDDEWALTIDLRDNNLTGQLPASWPSLIADGAFRDLDSINLDGNALSGPILPELGQISSLRFLSMNENELSGGLPLSLANLPNLIFLSFFDNNLTGPIPDTFYFMPNLQTLQLIFNQLTGELPSGIGQNDKLLNLRVSFNQLSGTIPPDIADGASIRAVDIGFNDLTGTIPPQLGGNLSMEQLDLSGNLLTGPIPPELGTLTNLTFLRLSSNQLTGPVPSELGNLSKLMYLDVAANDLTGDVPASLKDLNDLQTLFLHSNGFTSIPDFSGLPFLVDLWVFENYLEFDDLLPNAGISAFNYAPQRPFDSPQMIDIGEGGSATLDASPQQSGGNQYQWLFEGNAISGATGVTYQITNAQPADAGVYTLTVTNSSLPDLTLQSADINVTVGGGGGGQTIDRDALMALYNSTNGANWTNNTNWGSTEPISEWFGITESSSTPGTVTTISLSNNNLVGSLPSEWGSMITNEGAFGSLTGLLLGENQLSGSIPSELGSLPVLRSLALIFNQLSGPIPASLGSLDQLTLLSLGYNRLSGPIPSELGQIQTLTSLYLNDNTLTGVLPEQLGDLTNLIFLRVDQNGLSGDVPESLTLLSNLEELFVQTNFFESLPDFSATPRLRILNAQNNLFQFDDLEPNTSVQQYAFSPQRPIGPGQSLEVEEGGSLTISYNVGGSQNQYQWTLGASPISGATSDTYQITNAQQADEGNYVLTITSPLVPGLTLITENTFVDVTGGGGTQGEYVVTNTNDSGAGSLRQAILDANANPNEQGFLDEITFNIPGTGPHVIRPTSPLPDITESVNIDGETQPGATCGQAIADRDLRIVLDGSEAGGVPGGLVIRAVQNTALVSGMVIMNFAGPGILVDSSPVASIQCNFLGVDVTGSVARPNSDGILVFNSSTVLIGAGSGASGNVISGNSGYGVRVDGQGQSGGIVLYGNLIGTDLTGTAAVPNSVGVLIENGFALVGSPDEFQSNVISGNGLGVEVRGAASAGTFLTNNFIGTDVTGTQPIPNSEGVRVHAGASGVIVGFYTNTNDEGYTNLIAFNDGPGVRVDGNATTGVRISANRMFSNEGLGIDLGPLGLNVNDVGDADEGPNRLMNSPQIVSSVIDGGGDLIVNYLVESDGTDGLRIEFFGADADGEEGAFFIGEDTYFLNEAGQTVEVNLGNAASLGVSDPAAIVATATDSFGNTSEFSGAGSGPGGGNEFVVTEPSDVEAVSGGSVPLQVTVPTGFNASVREVCYRRIGEAEFTCAPMQAAAGGFEGSIPSSFVTARGVQYYFRFSDGVTETTVPAFDPENSSFVLPVQVDGLRAGGSFAPNTYRMVSIPVELVDGTFESVLDEYGPVNPNRWRLLRWEPTLEAYREYPDFSGGFDPCEAYWLITFDGSDFEIGEGRSVDPTEPCFVTVRPGWNQIASPYAFPVAWANVDFSGALDGPVLYDASAGADDPYSYNVQLLEPWQGYWVFNPGAQNVFMSFNPIEAVGKARKSGNERYLSGDEFELRLRASMPSHDLTDNQNHVGLSSRAADGFDDLDFAEAPPIGNYVRLSILEDGRRTAGSFRATGGDGQTWDLRISADVDGAPATGVVRVALDRFGLTPDGFELRLVDIDAGTPVRLDEDGFEVELTRLNPVRNLRLMLGTDAFTREAGGAIPEIPRHAELAQNYPNPFNPSTRIRYQVHVEGPVQISVVDPLGRTIRTLVDAYREPGWYDTVWNGRDESGAEVSSGIYFYVLTTTDGSDSRTMVLLR